MNAPLLVIGIDAGDPELLAEWTEAGLLPNLGRVLESGVWGQTGGPELIAEHGVWVTLNSGIPRSTHGYYWFRQLRPGTYGLEPVSPPTESAPPFWRELAGSGRRVLIVDVPDAEPLPGLEGLQVANWGIHDQHGPPRVLYTQPSCLGSPLQAEPIPEILAATPARNRRLLSALHRRLERKAARCRDWIRQLQPELAYIGFGETHTGGHQFFAKRGQPGEFGASLLSLYQGIDRELGSFLSTYAEPPNVALIGSVGLREEWPSEGFLADFCTRLGYAEPAGAGARESWRPTALARELLPRSLRNRLSAWLPRSAQERLLSEKFGLSLNWSRTRLFALPYFYMGLLRVNLVGREPRGIVNPGAEYRSLLDAATADLLALRDPEDGLPAVTKVHRVEQLSPVAPHPVLPDLFVEWRPSGAIRRRLVHPQAEITQPPPVFPRGTEHTPQGFFALAGPRIRARGNAGRLDPLAIAPTLGKLCGLPGGRFLAAPLPWLK